MFKILNRDTKQHRIAKEDAIANIAEGHQQKFNK